MILYVCRAVPPTRLPGAEKQPAVRASEAPPGYWIADKELLLSNKALPGAQSPEDSSLDRLWSNAIPGRQVYPELAEVHLSDRGEHNAIRILFMKMFDLPASVH